MESVMDARDEIRMAGVRARLADLVEDDPTPAEIALLGRLLRSFRDKTPAAAGVLIGLLRDGDADRVREQAHALKGSAANIGAAALAELCAAIEERARAGVVADPATTAERLDEEVAGALRAVAAVAADYEP